MNLLDQLYLCEQDIFLLWHGHVITLAYVPQLFLGDMQCGFFIHIVCFYVKLAPSYILVTLRHWGQGTNTKNIARARNTGKGRDPPRVHGPTLSP